MPFQLMVQNKRDKMEKLIITIKKYLESLINEKNNQKSEVNTNAIEATHHPIEVKIGENLESQICADNISNAQIENGNESQLPMGSGFVEHDCESMDFRKRADIDACMVEFSPLEVEEQPSLLENDVFIKMVEDCVDVMNEFESYTNRLESEESKMIVGLIVKRLQELLECAGLDRIDDVNAPFSVLCHSPVPMIPVNEGETIKKILKAGLILENRVFVKARVEI
jgi:hypothetical protein